MVMPLHHLYIALLLPETPPHYPFLSLSLSILFNTKSETDIKEPTPNPVSTPLATKKNRLASTNEDQGQDQDQDQEPSHEEDQDQDQSPDQKQKGEIPSRDPAAASASASASASGSKEKKETGNVGEVRRKVQEMNWKEGQTQTPLVAKDKDQENENEGEGEVGKEVTEEGKDLKRKSLDRNESGTLEPLSPKRIKETPSVCHLSSLHSSHAILRRADN